MTVLFGHTHPVIPVANKSSTVYFRRFIQSQSSGNRPGQFSRYISRCDIPTDIPTARFGGSNTSGGQIIRTGAKRHTKTPAKWATGSLSLGVKRPGRGVNHQPPSSAEVKERVELYLYSPSGHSRPVLGWSLLLLLLMFPFQSLVLFWVIKTKFTTCNLTQLKARGVELKSYASHVT